MAGKNGSLRKSDNQSMRKSRVGNRYFRVDPGYDKVVYENTIGNWFRIIGSFIVFYICVVLFWWAVFSHGIQNVDTSTYLYLAVVIVAWIVIITLIILGHFSNKNLHKAERLILEVNEEHRKAREEEEKKRKREEVKKEMKRLEELAMRDSLSDEGASKYHGKRVHSESEDNEEVDESSEISPDSGEDE